MEQQVTEKIETKLQELPYFYFVNSYTKPGETVIYVSLRDDTRPPRWPTSGTRCAKGRRHQGHPAAGVNGPFFNDEYGDTYSLIWASRRTAFRRPVKDIVKAARQRRSRADVTRPTCGPAGREDLHRVQPYAAGYAGRAGRQILEVVRKQNASWRPARSDRGGVTVRVDGAPVSPGTGRAALRATGRTLTLSDGPRSARLPDPQQISMRFKGKPVIGLGVVWRRAATTLGKALEGDGRSRGLLPVGITAHRVANQPGGRRQVVRGVHLLALEALAIVLIVSPISLGVRTGVIVAMSVPLCWPSLSSAHAARH
jgi:multidrug efflux pump